jgi:hypothetical protein
MGDEEQGGQRGETDYKRVSIVLQNGMELFQKDVAKIVGSVFKAGKEVHFEIDPNNRDDVYNLVRWFGEDVNKIREDSEKTTKRHS